MKKLGTLFLKRDNIRLGMVIGLLAPLLGLVILYYAKFPSIPFFDFLDFFVRTNRLITSLGSLCLLANVIFFTLYINSHRDNTAKGIFVITLIYGIGILLLKVMN